MNPFSPDVSREMVTFLLGQALAVISTQRSLILRFPSGSGLPSAICVFFTDKPSIETATGYTDKRSLPPSLPALVHIESVQKVPEYSSAFVEKALAEMVLEIWERYRAGNPDHGNVGTPLLISTALKTGSWLPYYQYHRFLDPVEPEPDRETLIEQEREELRKHADSLPDELLQKNRKV